MNEVVLLKINYRRISIKHIKPHLNRTIFTPFNHFNIFLFKLHNTFQCFYIPINYLLT